LGLGVAQTPHVRWACPAPRQAAQAPCVHKGVSSTEAGDQASCVRLVYPAHR